MQEQNIKKIHFKGDEPKGGREMHEVDPFYYAMGGVSDSRSEQARKVLIKDLALIMRDNATSVEMLRDEVARALNKNEEGLEERILFAIGFSKSDWKNLGNTLELYEGVLQEIRKK